MDNKEKLEPDEEMSVELELDDGTVVNCAVITVLEVESNNYIVLLPLDENGENQEGEVWFYQLIEDEKDPNKEPELVYIDDDEVYEKVTEAFDSFLDDAEFDELEEDDSES